MTPTRLKEIKENEWTYWESCRPIIMDCVAEIERLEPMEIALRDLYNDCRNEPCDKQRGAAMDRAHKALEAK